MKAVQFDAFCLAHAVSYCADVTGFAPPADGMLLPEMAWYAILKTARDVSLPDKKIGDLTAPYFS